MIDVSEFQGTINWNDVPRTRVYIRATYGSTGVDGKVAANVRGAFNRGCLVGLYHFQEENDPAAEVAHFLRDAKAVLPDGRAYQLRPALDCESSSFSHPTGHGITAAVEELHRRLDYYPVVYGNPSDLGSLSLPPLLAACPLWLADYGVNDGREHAVSRVPGPWKTWDAHQYTSQGHSPGIAGNVDLSSVRPRAGLEVPRPRMIIDKYKVSIVGKDGHRKRAWTRTPYLYSKVRRAERRGAVHIYPHRREA